jgi:hypothetical protein
MPTSPVDGVEVFYGTMLPASRRREGIGYVHRTLEFECVSAGDDFLVDVVSRVANATKAEVFNGALITTVECIPIIAGWAVKVWYSMHRLEAAPFADVVDARSPHPVIGEYRMAPRQVVLTDEDVEWIL